MGRNMRHPRGAYGGNQYSDQSDDSLPDHSLGYHCVRAAV
jgi:hypothetical protein